MSSVHAYAMYIHVILVRNAYACSYSENGHIEFTMEPTNIATLVHPK